MEMVLTFCGVDPGLNGGIACILGEKIQTFVIPTRRQGKKRVLGHQQLSSIITSLDCQETFAVVEQQHAWPKQGVSSMFSLGYVYGAIIQCLSDHSIPFGTARPREWQHEFGISAKNGSTKEQALEICQKLFPQANLLATARSKKPHEGIVDACLIAEYARRRYNPNLER